MTIWIPNLHDHSGPRYIAIADKLEEDLAEGRIAHGSKLPTHRNLARILGITVGTVTRAYAEAERRGLVVGEVGRGTFVRKPGEPHGESEQAYRIGGGGEHAMINLGTNWRVSDVFIELAREIVADIARDPDLEGMFAYNKELGMKRHRRAAARWFGKQGHEITANNIIITAGAQHALSVSLMSKCRPGDVILCEELTYPGMRLIASRLNLKLIGVTMDRKGLIPEALETAIRSSGAKFLYTLPTFQNPTGAVMPAERRQEIANICETHDLTIFEDDVYSPFYGDHPPPPIASFAPDRTIFISSLSKCISPGLRVAYIRAPDHLVGSIGLAVRSTMWMVSPLNAEIATRLIESGEDERIIQWHRSMITRRQALAREKLDTLGVHTNYFGHLVWVELPDTWHSDDLVAQARQRGLLLIDTSPFIVGRKPPPQAVRLNIGMPKTDEETIKGLGILVDILKSPHHETLEVM